MLHACTAWTSVATKQLIEGVGNIMKLNEYSLTPKQLRGRWETLVSSCQLDNNNDHIFGQGTRQILGKLEGRPTPNVEDTYFPTCTTNGQEGFCAP